MMKLENAGLDLHTATTEEIEAAMRKGVRAALRRHKEAGVPAVVWNWATQEIVSVLPEAIPDFPEDEEEIGSDVEKA